ncbi:MAG: hypothetical protein JEZ00_14045 [Anaerolineaceae bacterium]|nr:hypothetical protein [Anaerolineaceae bacterium]
MVIRSKLIPPQQQKAVLFRPWLQEKLNASLKVPLTLVHAGTGFGKTTALISLSKQYKHVYWYNITEPDRDPTLFLAHLISAFLPDSANIIEQFENNPSGSNNTLLNMLINQLTTDLYDPAVLILDDFHLVNNVKDIDRWLEQLIEHRPPFLHIAMACRQIPTTPAFIRWRVKGNIQIIDQSDLSFSQDEIKTLFTDHYQFEISDEQAATLYSYTDGWIIALQMIWQRLQSSRSKKLENILAALPSALTDIFMFLAQEVLMRQPENIQQFLTGSAILRDMDAESCNHLLDINNSQDILQLLNDRGLFISTVDHINFRYQRLFQDFLLNVLQENPEVVSSLHEKAADYFTQKNEFEEAVFHQFTNGNLAEAADLIEQIGPKLLEIGRLRTIAKWIEQLNDEQLGLHPSLNLLMGDVQRLRSKFEQAIHRYDQADRVFVQKSDNMGRSMALRSKAQVYLDTVRPLKASSLLEEAVGLLEPQEFPSEVAVLLDQLAENKVNLGKPGEARELHKEANMLRSESDPDAIYLEARTLLRTGKLHEASNLLESSTKLNEELSTKRPQKFHREMPLLLSLIYLMLGDKENGEKFARQGIEIGAQLDSPFVEAVGLMRLGHAYQLHAQVPWRMDRLDKARAFYEKAIALVKPFNVVRVQVEPLWGLCRFYGYQGNVAEAKRYATQAIDIADMSGDYWLVALLTTTMGTSYMLAGDHEKAEDWLKRGAEMFPKVGDTFGHTAAKSALALNAWQNGSKEDAVQHFAELVPQIRQLNLGFLLTRTSHLGIQDDQIFFPLILETYHQGIEQDWLQEIMKRNHLVDLDFHPGYPLQIRCLGSFDVWRGKEQIDPKDWQRKKARELLQLLLNNREKWMPREKIADQLFPHMDGDTAAQHLKVTFNALNKAIEPDRSPGKVPFFIIRRDNSYRLNPAAKIRLDVDDFSVLSVSDEIDDMKEALSIYQGDYLNEVLDDYKINEMREHLRETYLATAMKLSNKYIDLDQWEEAVKICHDILTIDRCNEPAFRMLMNYHTARGNRANVQAVYQRCCSTLREELDVEPSSETRLLWEALTK